MYETNYEIKLLLDDRAAKYNHPGFIATDPIQVPHRFSKKEDIEIAAFLTATIAWGQRKTIINNALHLMNLMDNSPYSFLTESSEHELGVFKNFVHRTFNGQDCHFFLTSLKNIYSHHGGLESVFAAGFSDDNTIFGALKYFRQIFLETTDNLHVKKHISDVGTNSAAKRLNMFLRWMVRKDENEVDFGIWDKIPAQSLMLPLDVHTAEVARATGILKRKQNDWTAVEEITSVLRTFDSNDPIKYDFALFGIGAFEGKNYPFPIIKK